MLVLTRKSGESVIINGNIFVKVLEVRGSHVRLAFEAPRAVRIMRSELVVTEDGESLSECDPDLEHKPAEWEADACAIALR